MTLDDEIRERFMTDAETILEAHLDDLEGMFQFHEDGTMELLGEYRDLAPGDKILVYLIARRYQYEADLADSDTIEYSELYQRFPGRDDSTVRGDVMKLRQAGFAKNVERGTHALAVERLPDAIERIEDAVQEGA